MKVRCLDNTLCNTLTVGKEYSVIDEGDIYFVIIDDEDNEIITKKERFEITVDSDLAKKVKATVTELNYQITNNFPDIKDFKIRKNSKGQIKQILAKFNYE